MTDCNQMFATLKKEIIIIVVQQLMKEISDWKATHSLGGPVYIGCCMLPVRCRQLASTCVRKDILSISLVPNPPHTHTPCAVNLLLRQLNASHPSLVFYPLHTYTHPHTHSSLPC